MPKNQPQPRQDQLISQYREIGPAVLVAALLNKTDRKGKARNDNHRRSILAIKRFD
ncbi:hydrolase [Falsochrobactrum sp. TDYN1]|uniref:Hydrolase n=1 Tax=Falsochrobactrum tianjinense TaxID=2706015 RepID=A0A949UU41_9HYPH|nr:hydrolase [Falsochrobactrum sp. TDYN1]MBV2142708.1 hydrolase [Falsochrobactrum sp. TDYN1]